MYTRAILKKNAKDALRRNYWKSVLVGLLLMVLTAGAGTPKVNVSMENGRFEAKADWLAGLDGNMIWVVLSTMLGIVLVVLVAAILLQVLVFNPLMVGVRRFSLVNAQQPASLDELGSGFGLNYKTNVKTMFMTDLYIVLWTLLFFFPGVVAAYRYRMVPYLLAEHPELSTAEALQKSRDMMKGQKWNAFVLDLSFIGWNLLAGLTFGLLAVFFVNPYKMQTDANLYLALIRGGQNEM